ncbi:replication initiator protein A [Deinococcus deserti]|uniref:Putative plasmid replication initiator protein n=1 Tax=Deinococcus deserti (strain DSM 17065 / CIP 109153 / LMG 22923 / VCD115) TaxID=546414 RepID=C1D420_DEIDV|nr:replication initiator protein A [Deinococcus deserti]ACO48249.1 putative plasmid replication initiator protein [Deinococcus deserti VCD115]
MALDTVDMDRWDVQFDAGDRLVRVSCEAMPKYRVPHGLDSDVTAALINLYFEQGEPDDGTLVTSVGQLIRLCGWHNNGNYISSLRESLKRLHTSSFTISGGWRDFPNRRWTHASFHFIERLSFSTPDQASTFDLRSIITLRLAEDIVASLRSGYVKPLDMEFMGTLTRPRTRVLYRVLDAARYKVDEPDMPLTHLEVNVLTWADQCKIPSQDEAWRVIKALNGPHEELKKKGYLRNVTISGRGRSQKILYEFSEDYSPIDPVLARRFRGYGVADGVARRLVRDKGRAFLIASMDRFDLLVKRQVLVVKKSPAAALMHLIAHPDDYPYPAQEASPRSAPARMDPLLVIPEVDHSAQFEGLSPEMAAERLIAYLNPHYRKLWGVAELDALRHAVASGTVQAGDQARAGITAVTQLKREAFVQSLRDELFQE